MADHREPYFVNVSPSGNRNFVADSGDLFGRARGVRYQEVEIPEWSSEEEMGKGEPVKVLLRSMTNSKKQRFDSRGTNWDIPPGDPRRTNDSWFRDRRKFELIMETAIKQDGSPLFKATDFEEFGDLNSKGTERLFYAASVLCGYDSTEFAGAAKNERGGGTGAALIASPEHMDSRTSEPSLSR